MPGQGDGRKEQLKKYKEHLWRYFEAPVFSSREIIVEEKVDVFCENENINCFLAGI